MMERQNGFSIEHLMNITQVGNNLDVNDRYTPEPNDKSVPETVLKYKPLVWKDNGGVWHAVLGKQPNECVYGFGYSPLQAMWEWDKELQYRLTDDGSHVKPISEHMFEVIHEPVLRKQKELATGSTKKVNSIPDSSGYRRRA
jgi:hypothetical protein